MKTYPRHISFKIDIPKDQALRWNEMLALTLAAPNESDVIDEISIDLGNSLRVNFALCNGSDEPENEDDECGPFIEASLFEGDLMIDFLAQSDEKVEGWYTFVTSLLKDGVHRSLTVEIELRID